MSTSRRTRAPGARARRAARSGRPSSSRTARTARLRHRAQVRVARREAGRARAPRAPWPRRSGASRPVAFPPARATHRLPAAPGLRRSRAAGRGRRIAPGIMTATRHLTSASARSSTSSSRCGVREACTSPGSRSTPLVLALARQPRLRATSHIDERSAGFFALGLAKATGLPAALACTSGTAAANYAPAVIEAHEARVPLLVLTADRPPELRDVGAGQTIDQVKLYGSAAKWFFEVDDHARDARADALDAPARVPRRAGPRVDGRPGPVHLNFSLREPLVLEEPLPEAEPGGGGRAGGRPWVTRPGRTAPPADGVADALADELDQRPRARDRRRPQRARPAARRRARGARRAAALAAAGRPAVGRAPRPGGRSPTTTRCCATPRFARRPRARARAARRRPADLQAAAPVARRARRRCQIALRPRGRLAGPGAASVGDDPRRATRAATLEALVERPPPRRRAGWLEAWRARRPRGRGARSRVARRGRARASRAWPRELGARLPAAATLFVASSMPVRDVETFFPRAATRRRGCSSNRGANGIDGTVVDRLRRRRRGARAGRSCCIGDVALAHDLGGLLAARRLRLDAHDRPARQRRRRDLRLPAGRRRRARRSRSTSPRRTGSTSRTPPRCSGSTTSARRRRPFRAALDARAGRRARDADPRPHRPRGERRAAPRGVGRRPAAGRRLAFRRRWPRSALLDMPGDAGARRGAARARPRRGSAPGDIVLVDKKGRRFHALVTELEQLESGRFELDRAPAGLAHLLPHRHACARWSRSGASGARYDRGAAPDADGDRRRAAVPRRARGGLGPRVGRRRRGRPAAHACSCARRATMLDRGPRRRVGRGARRARRPRRPLVLDAAASRPTSSRWPRSTPASSRRSRPRASRSSRRRAARRQATPRRSTSATPDHRPRRGDRRADGRADAPRRGGRRHPRDRRRRDADPRHASPGRRRSRAARS